jgi:tRNA nucleotidyltransferase (CCA-adding enzyme)
MDLLDAVRGLPGGSALLSAADDRTHLVGGTVRDLLLGRRPREFDVVVEGDPGELAGRLSSTYVLHDRFGTATLDVEGARVDIARSRRERYPAPGALPEVEPAGLEEDLLRRDFTVNAMAVSLHSGELRTAPRAREDLDDRLLRVLHESSFDDDPTRLLRLARYAVRLGFDVEPQTKA